MAAPEPSTDRAGPTERAEPLPFYVTSGPLRLPICPDCSALVHDYGTHLAWHEAQVLR